eukprot:TRINITY_DN10704_c0_g1_i2.p1 TRINITY_DN10704_c0_g1~~TRINITY_DN10704_c0_g1_i2.p1  ORF type:complete len:394 (+),score=122.20 TRINITY_DN10704_c0_g1_i2:55-1236(+)
MSGLDAPLLGTAEAAEEEADVVMGSRGRTVSHPPPPTTECVFVARFDVSEGNMIEWAHPFSPAQLAGVEYKALVSGAHTLEEDYVLFTFHGLHGVACFHKLMDENAPRGAWQRATGVLVRNHYYMEQHLEGLRKAARYANTNPGDYSLLEGHFKKWGAEAPTGVEPGRLPTTHPASLTGREAAHYLERYSLACGSVTALADAFAEKVFVLWRALLMGLRVVYLTKPPAGAASSQIHTAHGLLLAGEEHHRMLALPTWLYYVTVSDIDSLAHVPSYLACTTEQLFKHKPQLYDLLIDGDTFVPSKAYEKALAPLAQDRRLYERLREKKTPLDALGFFENLNNQLLAHVMMWRKDTPVRSAAVSKCGLNMAAAERFFTHHGYDINLPTGCCPPLC